MTRKKNELPRTSKLCGGSFVFGFGGGGADDDDVIGLFDNGDGLG